MVVLSNSVFNGAGEGHEKVLPSPELLAVWSSLHGGEHGFVICQDFKFLSSKFSIKTV